MSEKLTTVLPKIVSTAFFMALIVTIIFAFTKLDYNEARYLVMKIRPSATSFLQLFVDTGDGFSEKRSAGHYLTRTDTFQTLRFKLPKGELKRLRLDPLIGPGRFVIGEMQIVSRSGYKIRNVPMEAFIKVRHIDSFQKEDGYWIGVTTADAFDAQLMIQNSDRLKNLTAYPIRMRIQHVLVDNARLLFRLFGTVWLFGITAFGLRHWFGRK